MERDYPNSSKLGLHILTTQVSLTILTLSAIFIITIVTNPTLWPFIPSFLARKPIVTAKLLFD